MVRSKPKQRGASLLLVLFVSVFVLLPLIGLVMDGATTYWVRAKMSAAADAAALATARSLSLGQTASEQLANATAVGQAYFAANFPSGFMGITATTPTISVVDSATHVRTVTVTATVSVPMNFMRIAGFRNSTVGVTGQSTRRDSNVILILDRSGSMNNAHGSCGSLVSSAENFVDQFVDGRDRLGLVTFQTGAKVDYSPTLAFKSGSNTLVSVLNTLECGGDTNTAQGLYLAYQQIKAINQPGALNVILLFTDGQPNILFANFPTKNSSDTRYGAMNTSNQSSIGASSCTTTGNITGGLADGSNETATDIYGLNATGSTIGLLKDPGDDIDETSPLQANTYSGCSFNSNVNNGRQDIAYIPTTNINGYSTNSYITGLDIFPTSNTAYKNRIRPDTPRNIRWVAFNAADATALAIRNDSTYTPLIYSIGLQGNESMDMNQDFMERMANDPLASNYDPTKQVGRFILATNNSELSQAFQQVASQILRLSK